MSAWKYLYLKEGQKLELIFFKLNETKNDNSGFRYEC